MEWKGTISTPRWPVWLNAAVLLVVSWLAIASLSLHARGGSDVVAVAFPPWWDSQQVFAAAASADATIVRTTAIPALLVVSPPEHDGMTRLRRAGALLAMDPQAIAACFSKSTGR
jgi:hypothetical protein